MDTWVSSLATLVAFVALVLFLVPTVIALLLLLGSGVRLAFLLLLESRTRLPFLLPLRSRAGLLLLLKCPLRLVAPGLINVATRPLLVDGLRGF